MREGNKALEDATDETLTEGGGESYLEDDDYSMEHLEGSSSSFQDDYVETIRGKHYYFSINNSNCFIFLFFIF